MIKARMTCNAVHKTAYGETVELTPVYSSDKNSPNYTFSEATPCGKLELSITNKAVHGFFVPGKTYDIDITLTPEEPAKA